MKRIIIITVIAIALMGCKKSNVELEIEQYDLRKAQLGYLKDLMDTKRDMQYNQRIKLIDSLILEEKTRLQNNKQNN